MTVTAELPSGRLVAGGDSQGFFVSDDAGRTWWSRNVLRGGADPFASRGVASIAFRTLGSETPWVRSARISRAIRVSGVSSCGSVMFRASAARRPARA